MGRGPSDFGPRRNPEPLPARAADGDRGRGRDVGDRRGVAVRPGVAVDRPDPRRRAAPRCEFIHCWRPYPLRSVGGRDGEPQAWSLHRIPGGGAAAARSGSPRVRAAAKAAPRTAASFVLFPNMIVLPVRRRDAAAHASTHVGGGRRTVPPVTVERGVTESRKEFVCRGALAGRARGNGSPGRRGVVRRARRAGDQQVKWQRIITKSGDPRRASDRSSVRRTGWSGREKLRPHARAIAGSPRELPPSSWGRS